MLFDTKRKRTESKKRYDMIHYYAMLAYDDIKGSGVSYADKKIYLITKQGAEIVIGTFEDNYKSLKACEDRLIKILKNMPRA